MEMKTKLELPQGSHDQVVMDDFNNMIVEWTEKAIQLDKAVLQTHGEAKGKKFDEALPALAFVDFAKAALSLTIQFRGDGVAVICQRR